MKIMNADLNSEFGMTSAFWLKMNPFLKFFLNTANAAGEIFENEWNVIQETIKPIAF